MPARARLLVVDDDPGFVRTLQILLEDEGGYEVVAAHSGDEALRWLENGASAQLVISDLAMPGMDGLELLRRLREQRPGVPAIMLTAHSSVPTAVEAMQAGAFQYLAKPVEPDELLLQVERALELQLLQQEHRDLRLRTGDPARFDVLVGDSPSMQDLQEIIRRVADVDSTVLIRGETGTGKELVARLIHAGGPRAAGPFVVVNCTAIPGELLESELFGHEKGAFTGATASRAGRIEQANGGTLLLDEIGDMPLSLQPKLLRFLQEKRVQRVGARRELSVDIRVLAATHRNLESALREGEFREDLYHRLSTIPVTIPPLRERIEDLPALCEHLLLKIARRLGRAPVALEDSTMHWLALQPFAGNVRELENMLERIMVLGTPSASGRGDVHAETGPDGALRDRWDIPLANGYQILQQRYREAERGLIQSAVQRYPEASNSEIARRLGTARRVLERRMKEYGITKGRPRSDATEW